MKSSGRFFHWLAFVGSFLILWGCIEYNITTRIMPDGHIHRTIIVRGDSSNVLSGSYPVPSDSTWRLATRLEPRNESDADDSMIYVYEAHKEFGDFNELNQAFYNDSANGERTRIRVKLERKNKGFFRHYRYSETYSRLFPFHAQPLERYLNKTELRVFLAEDSDIYYSPVKDSILLAPKTFKRPVLTESDSLRYSEIRNSIQTRFESWQKMNIYQDFYELISGSLNKQGITYDTAGTRSGFYHWLDSMKTMENGLKSSDEFVDAASSYFKIDPGRLKAGDPDGFGDFNRKFRVAAFSLEKYTSTVIMPGEIIRGNAKKTAGNSATWIFQTADFYAADFEMTVESHLVNKWMIVPAGIVLLVLAGMLLTGRKIKPSNKKKKSRG